MTKKKSTLVIGTTHKVKRLLYYWVTEVVPIQTEINLFLQDKPIVELEIVEYEDLSGNIIKNVATYTIDENASWSDGVDITSHDYKFWLMVRKHPLVPVYIREPWRNATLTIISDKKFEITFEPAYLFIEGNAPLAAPAHLMKDSWEKWISEVDELKDQQDATTLWEDWLDKFTSIKSPPPVTNGTFIVKDWNSETITLTRRKDISNQTKEDESIEYISNVIYRFFKSIDEMLMCAKNDEIDIFIAPEPLEDLTSSFNLELIDTYNWEHIDINMFGSVESVRKLELDNPLIRRALFLSINRKKIVKELYSNFGEVSNSFIHKDSILYNPVNDKLDCADFNK